METTVVGYILATSFTDLETARVAIRNRDDGAHVGAERMDKHFVRISVFNEQPETLPLNIDIQAKYYTEDK